ncbi:DUF922 domain-containing protein [Mangrovimonas cancribranchiae]|uniref:DUF922 domain-containing protein n=1 Tax=Mangrovimonas cancribranchiae TaxID=3080055 RepID=A0AAU6P169_9FLAO
MIRLLALCCFFVGFSQPKEPVILWTDAVNLSWSNFIAQPDSTSGAVAVTASGIVFSFSVNTNNDNVIGFKTEVKSQFYPNKSWYKKNQVDAHVLAHEQLHFDITELFARKFRKRISQVKISNKVRDRLNAIHETILKELANFQNQYDNETDYSRNKDKQLQWQKRVRDELKELSQFKLE